jgi:hypothetical protein
MIEVGARYGYLVVLSGTIPGPGRYKATCRCDCGNIKDIYQYSLLSGNTKSCGCIKGKTYRKDGHWMTRTKEYRAWGHMKNRCMNPKNKAYKYYGARGISVCERWMLFQNFFLDMGFSPSADHSIDRIDNNGDYCPANCRWATVKEQRRNKRDNRILSINGENRPLSVWAEMSGVNYKTAHNRLMMGWSPSEAVYGKP